MQTPPLVVCLSSLFSTDRMLLHSTFMPRLLAGARPLVLSEAVTEAAFPQEHEYSRYFQAVKLPAGFPHEFTWLRHFETYLWDHAHGSASRRSAWARRKRRESSRREHLLHAGARLLAPLGIEKWVEAQLETLLVARAAPAANAAWLATVKPALVLTMYPFLESQMVTIAAAKRLGIPTLAFIASWDNLTTKARMIYQYDGYVVWSEQMKQELHEFYPQSCTRPVTVAGAPQYDVFRQEKYQQPRAQFLRCYGLDPGQPVIVYCLGSPNLIREDHGARQFVERLARHAELRHAQVIIRAHPGFREQGLTELAKVRAQHQALTNVVIQGPQEYWQQFPFQGEPAIVEWVNTVRHADVVINLSSTMTVDAAIFDRPVVNLDFDPAPGAPNQALVKEINRVWHHFAPVAQSGGVWLAADMDEVVTATVAYLRNPTLHAAGRRWIVERVCGQVDGQAGQRMAEAVLQLLGQEAASRALAAV